MADRVRWIWIPRWNLPAGQRDRQEVLPFPACNLVVEPDGIALYGPTTSISYRELEAGDGPSEPFCDRRGQARCAPRP